MERSLIIGGTRGLGRELAREARKRNTTPIILGRSAGKGIPDERDAAFVEIECDLTEREPIRDCVETLLELGGIRYIFWNAGIFDKGRFVDKSYASLVQIFQTIVFGPLDLIRQYLASAGEPIHLVSICSTTAYKVRSDETAYAGAKAAQAQMTRGLALELQRDLPGSRATLIFPGGMRTDFFKGSGIDASSFMDPAEVARLAWDIVQRPYEDEIGEFRIEKGPTGVPQVDVGIPLPVYPRV